MLGNVNSATFEKPYLNHLQLNGLFQFVLNATRKCAVIIELLAFISRARDGLVKMGHNQAHQLEAKDEHYTPKFIFEQLRLTFDLDVAAPWGGVDWIPAITYFDEEADGLAQNWYGRVWMNPPYSSPTAWVSKFIAHGNGIALLVVSRSKWFRDLWAASDAIALTPYNMKFERPDGHRKQISFQTMLFAIGDTNAQALSNLDSRVR